jgi:adenylosuccinate lyase
MSLLPAMPRLSAPILLTARSCRQRTCRNLTTWHTRSCASSQGKRAALPSATIMIWQPIQRFQQMQASDNDVNRNEIRKTNGHIVSGAAPS